MIINKLLIANYRSCNKLSVDCDSNIPNIFIGLNDCGKSTILQSIDLLLGDRPTYNSLGEGQYKSDLSNSPLSIDDFNAFLTGEGLPLFDYAPKQTVVVGKLVFTDNELEVYKGLSLSNTLSWALENSTDNVIWIAKTYSHLANQFMLLTMDDASNPRLWEKSAADLNAHLKQEEITAKDIQNENGKGRFSNMEKIRAGYNKKTLIPVWTAYKFGKSDKDIFPEFQYFDWNCSFEDINSLANAIMKEHIDVQLKPLKESAMIAASEAEKEINKKFGELSEVIKSVAKGVENINSKVHFDVKEKISDIMVQKTNSDGFIHLENQGDGLKRQIWFSLIKSKAEASLEDGSNKFIWAFDEPETHLFPGAQREFFDILTTISLSNVQTLISTHSTVFIDKSKIDKISSVSQASDGYTRIDNCTDIDSIYSSLSVKNSDFLFYDKFLIVEGDTEQYLIPKLFELYTKSTLLEKNIQLINIQGKNKWTINKALIDKVMKGFKKSEDQVVYLFDNDMSFEIGVSAKTANMFFVGDQDIEDAIPNSIWVAILNEHYNSKMAFTPEEIEAVKGKVAKGGGVSSNDKFYIILKKHIKKKWMDAGNEIDTLEWIPSKGNESAEFLLSKYDDVALIPAKITQAFDKILE
ncbi:MAG: putative ATP-dependent endonuclease of OLD family [Crocinitomicaceae bacterium]|jgi:putative ATP-dependent endonuclease of OLD family